MAKQVDRPGFFKRNFNFKQWSDYDRIKQNTTTLGDTIRRYFTAKQPEHPESFEDAIKRLGLSEQELATKMSALFKLSLLMLSIALLILGYFILQVFTGTWRSVLVSGVVMLLPMSLAFRYHFLHFQIKHRKLGCTLNDWAKGTFRS
ncbi:MAG: type IV secretion protein IcmV [Legionellales bacterium]|nr:type IV secretion protein IcmV [Legionellales bacterium]